MGIKTKIFEYCEGWKALYGDIDQNNIWNQSVCPLQIQ